jgi:hypothetical protein
VTDQKGARYTVAEMRDTPLVFEEGKDIQKKDTAEISLVAKE